MVTGELAAQAVASASSLPALAAGYGRACNYEIGQELRDFVRIQRYLFADRRRIGRLVAGAHCERAMTRLIAEFAAGLRPYRDLRRRMLAKSPLLLLSYLCDCLT